MVTLYDIGLQKPYGDVIKEFNDVKWYPYVPLDSLCTLDWMSDQLRSADKVLCMSKYGEKKLREELGLNTECIPHGVDTELYSKNINTNK